MATKEWGVNANEAVKTWSRSLWSETLKDTVMAPLMGKGKDSFIVVKEELTKGPGDRVRQSLRYALGDAGVEGDATLEGNEEALQTFTDDLLINQLRHGVRSHGEMSEQRVPWTTREEAHDGLRDWWADRIDTALLNQAAGNTSQADTRYTGHNATLAPTSLTGNTRIFYGGGTDTTEGSLSTNAETLSLTYIDRLIAYAKVSTPILRPGRIQGKQAYVLILHPYTVTALTTKAASTGIQWFDIQRAEIQGGKSNSLNTLMNSRGFVGQYKNVFLMEDSRVPLAPGTTNVYRSPFLGAQSLMIGFGRRYAGRRMSWKEKLFDYDNQLGVKAGMIWGVKKTQFNSRDHGLFVLSTYAAAP